MLKNRQLLKVAVCSFMPKFAFFGRIINSFLKITLYLQNCRKTNGLFVSK